MDGTVGLRSPRSIPELKMLPKMSNSFCVLGIPVLWFFCREDRNKGGRSFADTDLFMNLSREKWALLVTKSEPEIIHYILCCCWASSFLELIWSQCAATWELPAWIYVKAFVCYPHRTEGASDGPSWSGLARALQGFWFEWECARCFSSGQNYPWDEGNGRSTIHFFTYQTSRFLRSCVDPEECPCPLHAASWLPDNLGSTGDIFSHFFTSSYGYAFPVTRDPCTRELLMRAIAEQRHGFKANLHKL